MRTTVKSPTASIVPVITNEKPHEIQLFKFGLTPFWAKSKINLFIARAEGDYNLDENPTFQRAAAMNQKKSFRKTINVKSIRQKKYLSDA